MRHVTRCGTAQPGAATRPITNSGATWKKELGGAGSCGMAEASIGDENDLRLWLGETVSEVGRPLCISLKQLRDMSPASDCKNTSSDGLTDSMTSQMHCLEPRVMGQANGRRPRLPSYMSTQNYDGLAALPTPLAAAEKLTIRQGLSTQPSAISASHPPRLLYSFEEYPRPRSSCAVPSPDQASLIALHFPKAAAL